MMMYVNYKGRLYKAIGSKEVEATHFSIAQGEYTDISGKVDGKYFEAQISKSGGVRECKGVSKNESLSIYQQAKKHGFPHSFTVIL